MIKNLNQLKKILKKGTCFEIIGHCREEYVGQKRMVTVANTQGFYSIIPDDPENKITLANNGKGSVLWWSKAGFWKFENGVCSVYSSNTEHTEKFLLMSFKVEEKEAA